MEKTRHKVRKRARRYKKLFEKVSVSSLPWEVNGTYYFLVSFFKFKELQGSAVMAPKKKDEFPKDAHEAHKPLFQFYRLMNHIHVTGYVRISISPSFFEVPIELSERSGDSRIHEGRELIQSLYSKQKYFKEIYTGFFAELAELQKKEQPLTQKEIDLAVHTIATLEILHYEIMRETADCFTTLKNWVDAMKEEALWQEMKENEKVFYNQMVQNKDNLLQQLDTMPVVKHKNPDQMLKLTKQKYINFKDDARKKDLAELRYPQ